MINIVIVDDEFHARQRLKTIIDNTLIEKQIDYCTQEFENGSSLFKHKECRFDIIFLDIEMGIENGIQISKEIIEINRDAIIIFVTSHDECMADAFGFNVYKYIMKDDILQVVPKVLETIFNDLYKKKYIIFKSEEGPYTVKYNEIIAINIANRKIILKTDKEEIRIYGTSLKALAKELDDSFLFPNANYIVNARYIKKIEGGIIIMDNNDCIFISKGKVKKITEAYTNHLIKEASL